MPIDNTKVLPALLPDPSKTQFPVPSLISSSGSSGTFTYESLLLNGSPMPGQWLLTACKRTFGWEERKGWGLTGATLIPVGDGLLTATFKIKIWNGADAALYQKLLRTTLRKPVGLLPGSTQSAGMSIDQPQINALGVQNVVVESVSALLNPLVESGGKGAWTAEVVFKEYRPPVAAVKTPDTTYPDKGQPQPSAESAIDIENQRLANQAAATLQQISLQLSGGPTP